MFRPVSRQVFHQIRPHHFTPFGHHHRARLCHGAACGARTERRDVSRPSCPRHRFDGGGRRRRCICQDRDGKDAAPISASHFRWRIAAGAGGSVGADAVFHSAPDGYTLLASQPAPITTNDSALEGARLRPGAARGGRHHVAYPERAAGAAGLPRQDRAGVRSPTPRRIPASSTMRRRAPAPHRI